MRDQADDEMSTPRSRSFELLLRLRGIYDLCLHGHYPWMVADFIEAMMFSLGLFPTVWQA